MLAGQQDDDVCQVCSNGDTEEGNEIVYCESCNLPVHQKCYGIEGDVSQIDWFCAPCQAFIFEDNSLKLTCAICQGQGGALRPTNLSSHTFHEFQRSLVYPNQTLRVVTSEYTLQEVCSKIDDDLNFEEIILVEKQTSCLNPEMNHQPQKSTNLESYKVKYLRGL